ncbi:endonuclease/exonuclease/phosphatase family protein [Vibrio sp. CAU 1672]|uniref:endonuclease/exonuclease/phosphatase family protein n=1 Tax=Vibrio sp. CAU 1672 TaxID=3032594 RepID=UPI0023DA8297|nr:endonuclease/exonuclease/phosphatase family protein [Vibrio sp. CAU 1672]MDF2154839.1 endonuclease/exonuclease/phosphatase family protein [Vibrio sp. CAU 1672]
MPKSSLLTFASANLFNFVAPPNAFYDFANIYSSEDWQDKLLWTRRQIATLDPDIIGLQEVFSIDETRQFMKSLGYPYFATVDAPHIEQEYIYSHPVVALASRYPIIRSMPVSVSPKALEPFSDISAPPFSRKPLYAKIAHPHLGTIAFYVTHLKSQRPTEPENTDQAYSKTIAQWLSTQQRGWEATMLRQAIDEQYRLTPMPTVLVGDFNQPLCGSVNEMLVTKHSASVTDVGLQDGWELQVMPDLDPRPATHYHFSKGNVLDYILLSQEFDSQSARSVAEVVEYTVLDIHLRNPSFSRDKNASDHAFVALTVKLLI